MPGQQCHRGGSIDVQMGDISLGQIEYRTSQARPNIAPARSNFTKRLRMPEIVKAWQQSIQLLLTLAQTHLSAARRSRRR